MERKLHLCECGCGGQVKRHRWKKNVWNRYIHGHYAKDPNGRNKSGWHHSKEVKQYLSSICIGRQSPMKGRKRSEESKIKNRNAKLGKPNTKETNEKIRIGVNKVFENPEIRKKCSRPNQILSKEHIEKVKQFMLNAWQNKEFREKLVGENANNWQGGITFEEYGKGFNKQLKSQILERDNYTCQNPDCIIPGKKLDIHHIDYNKKHNSKYNLITLCCICHPKTNRNRKFWIYFYQNIIQQIYGKKKVS